MSELMVVGTWLHHWFPRTHCLNKYYMVRSYTCYSSYSLMSSFASSTSVLQKYCHGQS